MAGIGEFIDGMIMPFAPERALKRMAARMGAERLRQYDASASNRRTQGWKRPSTNQDAENFQGLINMRNGVRDLTRNNAAAASALDHLVTDLVGGGVTLHAEHKTKLVQRRAQDEFDRWAEGQNCDTGTFYEHQNLAVRGTIEAGEVLTKWQAKDNLPNAHCVGLEADFLDIYRTMPRPNGGRVVQGVEFDKDGNRIAYWLFPSHPGDFYFVPKHWSEPVDAKYIDHVYQPLRFGQTRGVSMFAPVAMALRDVADTADALRLKEKVQACLALIISPADGQVGSPLTNEVTPSDTGTPDLETLRPGMVARLKHGETATTLEPSQTSGGVEFMRQQLQQISACLAPYYAVTGDASQSSYTAHRALLMAHYGRLDELQSRIVEARICRPAFARQMQRLALQTGDARFLEVRARWSFPTRRAVDPVKDLMAEIMEIRAGLKDLPMALRDRGLDPDTWFANLAQTNAVLDKYELLLNSDPRRLTDQGILQATVAAKTSAAKEAA